MLHTMKRVVRRTINAFLHEIADLELADPNMTPYQQYAVDLGLSSHPPADAKMRLFKHLFYDMRAEEVAAWLRREGFDVTELEKTLEQHQQHWQALQRHP